MTPPRIDFEGIAPTNQLEAARAQISANLAALVAMAPDLDPAVWRAVASLVAMAHLLGLREGNAESGADLHEVIGRIDEGRAK